MVGKSIKKIGIVLGQEEKEETADRYKGFEDAIKDSGMKVAWKYNGIENKDIVKIVNRRSKVDAIVALDNYSLDDLGENARRIRIMVRKYMVLELMLSPLSLWIMEKWNV